MLSLNQRKKAFDSIKKTDIVDFIIRRLMKGTGKKREEIVKDCPVLSEIFTRAKLLYITDRERAERYLYRKLLSDRIAGYHFLYHYHDSFFNGGSGSTGGKLVIRTPLCKVGIHFFDEPRFDFAKLPLKEIRYNRKNNTIFLRIPGKCSRTTWLSARQKYSSDIGLQIRHLLSGHVLFLLFDYRVERYHYYDGYDSSSHYHRYYVLVFDFSNYRYVFFRVKNSVNPGSIHENETLRNILLFLNNFSGKYQTNIHDRRELKLFLKRITEKVREQVEKGDS